MSWHLHRWSRWQPVRRDHIDRLTGLRWKAPYQGRECGVCGKRQEEAL